MNQPQPVSAAQKAVHDQTWTRTWDQLCADLHDRLRQVSAATGLALELLIWEGKPSEALESYAQEVEYTWTEPEGQGRRAEQRAAKLRVVLSYRVRDASTGHIIEKPLALRYAAQIGSQAAQ